MYIIEVINKNSKIRGIGIPNNNGEIALVGDFKLILKRKFLIFKEYNVAYKKAYLTADKYTEFKIISELDSFEKMLVFNMLDNEFQKIYSEFYGKDLLEKGIFFDKTESFISNGNLSLLELSVIHDLFRQGIAKVNIVGFEIYKEDKRISFNLSDTYGVKLLMGLISTSLNEAERIINHQENRMIEKIILQLRQV